MENPALLCTIADRAAVGSKAACLLELQELVPVPSLVCVPGFAYVDHIRCLSELPAFLQSTGDEVAEHIQAVHRAVLELPMAPLLSAQLVAYVSGMPGEAIAVRSSCIELEDGGQRSFAGQFASELNVTAEFAPQAVKRVWASVWTLLTWQALAPLRHAERVSKMAEVAMAVILQEQVDSMSSGISFTRSPVASQPQCILVEACWGQGQGIADGRVVPDRWVFDRATSKLVWKEIVHKPRKSVMAGAGGLIERDADSPSAPSLSDDHLPSLVAALWKIEGHYGTPQDVEFAVDRSGNIWILQARPITAGQVPAPRPPFPFRSSFEAHAAEPYRYVLHHGPASRAFASLITSINAGFYDASAEYGATTVGQLAAVNDYIYSFKKATDGDIEAKIAMQAGIFTDKVYLREVQRWNSEVKPDLISRHLELQTMVQQLPQLNDDKLCDVLHRAFEHARNCWYVHGRYGWVHQVLLGDLLWHVQEWTKGEVSNSSVLDALSHATAGTPCVRMEVLPKVLDAFGLCPCASAFLLAWEPAGERVAAEAPGAAQVLEQLCVLDIYKDGEADDAEAQKTLRDALRQYRAHHDLVLVGGTDFSSPTCQEVPELLVAALQSCLQRPPGALGSKSLALRDRLLAQPELQRLLQIVGEQRQAEVLTMMEDAYLVGALKNERSFYTVSWAHGILRMVMLHAANRLVAKGLLNQAEHAFEVDPSDWRDLLLGSAETVRSGAARLQCAALWDYKQSGSTVCPPHVLGDRARVPPAQSASRLDRAVTVYRRAVGHRGEGTQAASIPIALQDAVSGGRAMLGTPASGGVGCGKAVYVRTIEEAAAMPRGAVLVVKHASPTLSVALAHAAAVVTEEGGALCHMAICARELGLPAVVGCSLMDQPLKCCDLHGCQICVEGMLGHVEVVEQPEHRTLESQD